MFHRGPWHSHALRDDCSKLEGPSIDARRAFVERDHLPVKADPISSILLLCDCSRTIFLKVNGEFFSGCSSGVECARNNPGIIRRWFQRVNRSVESSPSGLKWTGSSHHVSYVEMVLFGINKLGYQEEVRERRPLLWNLQREVPLRTASPTTSKQSCHSRTSGSRS